MKMRFVLFLYVLASTIWSGDKALALTPEEILRRMDEVMFQPGDQTSNARMVMVDRNGNERVREATIWQKGGEKRLFRFTSPASEAGIAFLSLPNDLMYLYLPAFGRERRIAAHLKNQNFAGTDFTYEDLEVRKYAESFSGNILRQDGNIIVLEIRPLPGITSEYSRTVVTLNRTNFLPEKTESYDRGGNLVKSATHTWARQGAFWYPQEIHMRDVRRGSSTRMIMRNVRFNTNLSDQIFTVRNLTSF
ncbi:MAG TPA: hypothetical protein DCM62_07285 [Bacteroidales bacterium]|nr:hypothetical protein [Bacteroidales bacterium]